MSRTRKSWKPLLHAYPRIRPTIEASKPPAATPHSWKGLRDEQCYHFRRARRARQVGEGLRVRPGNGRDRQEILRARAGRDRLLGRVAAPARQMRLRVGRDGLPPLPRAERDGRRLRRRRRVQDAQARRRPGPQDRQARRAVPRGAARAGRGHRGARARSRVRGRARI